MVFIEVSLGNVVKRLGHSSTRLLHHAIENARFILQQDERVVEFLHGTCVHHEDFVGIHYRVESEIDTRLISDVANFF